MTHDHTMAFPANDDDTLQQGMFLRDYFAAQVIASVMNGRSDIDLEIAARFSYRIADALMAARTQEN